MVVQRRHFDAGLFELGHDRCDFTDEQHKVAHDHPLVARLLEGEP